MIAAIILITLGGLAASWAFLTSLEPPKWYWDPERLELYTKDRRIIKARVAQKRTAVGKEGDEDKGFTSCLHDCTTQLSSIGLTSLK